MKHESDLRPQTGYEIENIENNRCEVVFFDLDSIEEEKRVDEEGNEKIVYLFCSYREKMSYNSKLDEYLEKNYDELLNKAKENDYNYYAKLIREKRNKLLESTDKMMAFDRLGINLPENITMTNIISVIKDFAKSLSNISKGSWAKYRQDLRDITKQEGFPYNVIFPEEPKE